MAREIEFTDYHKVTMVLRGQNFPTPKDMIELFKRMLSDTNISSVNVGPNPEVCTVTVESERSETVNP